MHTSDISESKRPGRKDGLALDPARIKSLREEAGFTQQEAGARVHQRLHANKPRIDSPTQLVTYQRIERTGRTSRKYATALALVLNASIEVLQGDAPEDAVSLSRRVEARIRSQLAAGTNPLLQARLQQIEGDGDHVAWLAEDLASEIEQAQLSQPNGELSRLSQLTGWSETALQNAGAVRGHWLVTSPLGFKSELTTGLDFALQSIKDECAQGLLNLAGSDVTIALTEELPWLRIEVSSPRWQRSRRRRLVFSLVRCVPTRRGLTWQNPTWRDRDMLDRHFLHWAYGHADFLRWQGAAFPEDIWQLRLLVERRVGTDGPEQVALLEGCVAEVPQAFLDDARERGYSHGHVTRCLRQGLWEALAPHLAGWPLEHWEVSAGSAISVRFDTARIPLRVRMRSDKRPPTLTVWLVERLGSGVRQAPWRLTDVEAAADILREQLRRAKAEAATGPPHPDPWRA